MDWKLRLSAMAGAVMVSGMLLAGAALAENQVPATPGKVPAPPAAQNAPGLQAHQGWIDEAIEKGELTKAEGDVLRQIHDLRRAHFEKLKAESKAIIDKAVTDGKITKEQGDRMMHKGHHAHKGHEHHHQKP